MQSGWRAEYEAEWRAWLPEWHDDNESCRKQMYLHVLIWA